MIKHIVCFKLHEATDEARAEAARVLRSMDGKVPQIIAMEVGTDVLHSDRSFDVILQVTVKDRDALDAYQNDPYHCGVVKTHMHQAAEKSVAIDYEI